MERETRLLLDLLHARKVSQLNLWLKFAQFPRYPEFVLLIPSANPPNSQPNIINFCSLTKAIWRVLTTIFTQLERIGFFLSSLISGRRGSNSRHPPWQGGILPLNYPRNFLLGAHKPLSEFIYPPQFSACTSILHAHILKSSRGEQIR